MENAKLRTGYTTGACATATSVVAFYALITGRWKDSVTIQLPRNKKATFEICHKRLEDTWAQAGTIKDAGDDPDVTHGAEVRSKVWIDDTVKGVQFKAGKGIGIITKPGLPLPVGEPAINPVPRKMITTSLQTLARELNVSSNLVVEVSIPKGCSLAKKTWNPRLGIEGGLSILGTTGIVKPFSCSAWIASIRMGIDVAKTNGAKHVCASTGSVSEQTAQKHLGLPDWAMLEMGDFAGGTFNYLRKNPIPNLTIAGGFGKLSKLATGALDLHSKRSQVNLGFLTNLVNEDPILKKNVCSSLLSQTDTANQFFEICGDPIAKLVAMKAKIFVQNYLMKAPINVEILIVDREGKIRASTYQDT